LADSAGTSIIWLPSSRTLAPAPSLRSVVTRKRCGLFSQLCTASRSVWLVLAGTLVLVLASGTGRSLRPSSRYSSPVPSGMGKKTEPSCGCSGVDIVSGRKVSL